MMLDSASSGLVLLFAFALGAMIGSFLNVVVHRLPRMMERQWRQECAQLRDEPAPEEPPYNLATPGSSCPHCGQEIRWYHNIPILSYLWLRGRCSHCAGPISARYPLLEFLTAVVTVFTVWHFGPGFLGLGALFLVWGLLALTFIDFETQLLPDNITLPLVWLGLLWNLGDGFASLSDAVVGAVAGYLLLWSVYHLFKLITGKEGMGYGDFKLLAALGAWLGWQVLPIIILASSVVGALVGILMILMAGHDKAKPLPFGPYLALGGLVALFWGQDLLQAYLS